MKKIASLTLILILASLSFCAQADFAPLYQRFQNNMQSGVPQKATITASILEWSPFTKERIDPFNRLLKHMALEVTMSGNKQNGQNDIDLIVGEQTPIALTVVNNQGRQTLHSGLIDNRALIVTEGTSALDTLFDTSATNSTIETLLNEEALFALPQTLLALREQAGTPDETSKKIKEKIKLPGSITAAGKITYTRPVSEASTFLVNLVGNLQDAGLLSAPSPVTPQSDTVTLLRYYLKDGTNVGIGAKFEYQTDGTTRKASLLWSYKQTENGQTDALEITTTNANGKDKHVFKANIDSSYDAGTNRLTINATHSYTLEKEKCSDSFEASLSVVAADNNERLFGQIKKTLQTSDQSQTMILSPSVVTIDYTDSMALKGGIRIKTLKNEAVTLDTQIDFTLADTNDADMRNVSDTAPTDVATLSMAEWETLQDLAMKSAVGNLVRSVLALPKEDLILITQFIDDADWETIISNLTQFEMRADT